MSFVRKHQLKGLKNRVGRKTKNQHEDERGLCQSYLVGRVLAQTMEQPLWGLDKTYLLVVHCTAETLVVPSATAW